MRDTFVLQWTYIKADDDVDDDDVVVVGGGVSGRVNKDERCLFEYVCYAKLCRYNGLLIKWRSQQHELMTSGVYSYHRAEEIVNIEEEY